MVPGAEDALKLLLGNILDVARQPWNLLGSAPIRVLKGNRVRKPSQLGDILETKSWKTPAAHRVHNVDIDASAKVVIVKFSIQRQRCLIEPV